MAQPSLLIGLRETEFVPLLDRIRTTTCIKEHLGPWVGLLRDVTNYGSNLIPRCFSSSDKKLEDAVVIAILLRQAVAMLDGVDILLSNGAPHAANLQMRALFEACVYIDWMMEGDLEKKARYYYVHNLRRKRLWASRTQPGSPESQEFASVMMKEFDLRMEDEVVKSAKEQIPEIDRVLSQPNFAAINNDFENCRKEKRHEVAWYYPLGQRSFRTIARAVNRASLYEVLYSGASEVMHTSNYAHHIRIGGDKITFQPIRSVEGFEQVFRFSVGIALHTFRRLLKKHCQSTVEVW